MSLRCLCDRARNAKTEEARDIQRLGGKIFLVDGKKLSEMTLNSYNELDEEIK